MGGEGKGRGGGWMARETHRRRRITYVRTWMSGAIVEPPKGECVRTYADVVILCNRYGAPRNPDRLPGPGVSSRVRSRTGRKYKKALRALLGTPRAERRWHTFPGTYLWHCTPVAARRWDTWQSRRHCSHMGQHAASALAHAGVHTHELVTPVARRKWHTWQNLRLRTYVRSHVRTSDART